MAVHDAGDGDRDGDRNGDGLARDGLTVGRAHALLAQELRTAGLDTPGLDARHLVAAASGLHTGGVLTEPHRLLAPRQASQLADFARRRLAREPVSRILGRRGFHALDLAITPDTLDPRPETETLVEGVLSLLRTGDLAPGVGPDGAGLRLLDLGTGSGAILLALLAALPGATGLGTDRSAAALAVAAGNARALGLEARAAFQHADWLEAVSGSFDVIVSNPPYIATGDLAGLAPEVRAFDPAGALDGGPDGLAAYRALVPPALGALPEGGWLCLEVGAGQAADVLAIGEAATASGLSIAATHLWPDLGGIERCVAMQICRRP